MSASRLERDLAFWLQFAELWKHLAALSDGAQRSDYLQKAERCLYRAKAVRAGIAPATGEETRNFSYARSFPPQPALPFTQDSIESIRPGQLGCYGVFKFAPHGIEWIYVGKGDIRERLLEHLSDSSCIAHSGPTHWMAAVTPDADLLEKQLIAELNPDCNQKLA